MAKVDLHARALFMVASLATAACADSPSVSVTDLGVPWELAELRSTTLSDIRYAYRITVPRLESELLTGSVEVRFMLRSMGNSPSAMASPRAPVQIRPAITSV